ncbi:hypothetical protein ID866_10045, partial [Astraeus odoratus]
QTYRPVRHIIFFGFIRRSLIATQHPGTRTTDIEKWKSFSESYQESTSNINLLATVLLSANVGFLAIGSVDQAGPSYWPQKLSYLSLAASMASILVGLAVRAPRFLTTHHTLRFYCMVLVLGSPFVYFFSSVLLFINAILYHWYAHSATYQAYTALLFVIPAAFCLGIYGLITEPVTDELAAPVHITEDHGQA